MTTQSTANANLATIMLTLLSHIK